MIEKISICLFHPRMMGRYILEKTWKVIVLLVVLFLVNVATIFAVTFHETTLTTNDKNLIISTIVAEPTYDISFNGREMTGNKVKFDVDGINIIFLDEYKASIERPLAIVFKETGFETYFYQFKVGTGQYSDYDFRTFNFADGYNEMETLALLTVIRTSFEPLLPLIAFTNSMTVVMDLAFVVIMLFALMLLLGRSINYNVTGIFRIRLVLHALVSYFFVYWFYLVFNLSLLYYAALIVPYLYYFLAMKNIVRIEKRRK